MSLFIRSMTEYDLDSVCRIESSAHQTPWSRLNLSDCLRLQYDCRVLLQEDEIIGYIISRYNLNICHILNLSVEPLQQNKGYGDFLLKEFIESLKKRKIKQL